MCVINPQRPSLGSALAAPVPKPGNTSLKIVYISHLHPPTYANLENIGGMQTVSLQLLQHLKRRQDISVLPLVMESPWQGTEWRTLGFLVKLLGTLPRIIHQHQADVVLFSSMVTAALAPLLRSRVAVPMVAINHGQDVTLPVRIYQKWVPKVFHHLQGVISVSAATQVVSLERGLHPNKSFVLPNALNIGPRSYHQPLSRQVLESVFQTNLADKHLLLSVGRQVQRKGHAWFIQHVLPKIQQPVVYLLIGQGPETQRLKHLRAQSICPEQIIVAGRTSVELLQHAYDAADLFIMPNIPVEGDMEGFGVVILEANEARTPVVASDLEGLQDVVQNGRNGFKVAPLDDQQFAQTIDEVLVHQLSRLSNSAYDWVTEQYAWPKVCEQYIEVLRQISGTLMPVLSRQ